MSKDKVSGYYFFTLVSANKSNLTTPEVRMAGKARDLYRRIGFP